MNGFAPKMSDIIMKRIISPTRTRTYRLPTSRISEGALDSNVPTQRKGELSYRWRPDGGGRRVSRDGCRRQLGGSQFRRPLGARRHGSGVRSLRAKTLGESAPA